MVAKVRIWERLRCADIDRVVMWSRDRCLPKAPGFSVSRTMTGRSSIKTARTEKDLRFFSQSFYVYRRRRRRLEGIVRILPMRNPCLRIKSIVFEGETGSKQV